MTFARPRFARRPPRWSLASLGEASLLGTPPPRFARRSLASLGWRPLKTVPPRANPPGVCTDAPERNSPERNSPERNSRTPPYKNLKVLWTSGVVPPEGLTVVPVNILE